MKKNWLKQLSSCGKILISIYLLGCGLWFLVWLLVGGYEQMTYSSLMLIPFLSTFIILIVNLLLSGQTKIDNDHQAYEKELHKMQLIERNAAHMVTAITGVLVISAAISVMKNNEPIPLPVIMFESIAFICAVVGVLPKYWIPSTKPEFLLLLRHFKTVLYTYSISLFLGGLLSLLKWL